MELLIDRILELFVSIWWFIVMACSVYLIIKFFELLGKLIMGICEFIEWLLTPYRWLCSQWERLEKWTEKTPDKKDEI